MGDEHDRRRMVERAMGPLLLLVPSPRFIFRLSLIEQREVVHGQAFISQSAVNALKAGVFHWFAKQNDVELILRRYSQISIARDWNFVS